MSDLTEAKGEGLNSEEATTAIKSLTKTQREAFDLMCVGLDGRFSRKTFERLVQKKLAVEYEEVLPGRFPVRIKRYGCASIAVHIAWAETCSAEVESASPVTRVGG